MQLLSPLLLPLGVWLLLSAATSSEQQRTMSRWALVAVSVAVLGFIGFGFELGFGAYRWASLAADQRPTLQGGIVLSAILADGLTQPVVLAGMPRPLSPQAPAEVLWLALTHLPFVLAASLLISSVVVLRGGRGSMVFWTLLVACVWLPLAFAGLTPQGWLSVLSIMAAEGAPSTRMTDLAVVGLVAGGAGLGWLLVSPRRESVSPRPSLPPVHVPWRAVAGALCVWAGSAGVMDWDVASAALFVNLAAALSAAVLTAGAYTAFVAREPDTLSAARAALGAVLIATGTPLSLEWSLAAGLAAGVLATVGHYVIYERWRLADEVGLIASVFLPAGIGAVLQTLFAPAVAAIGVLVLAGVPMIVTLAFAALFRPKRSQAMSSRVESPASTSTTAEQKDVLAEAVPVPVPVAPQPEHLLDQATNDTIPVDVIAEAAVQPQPSPEAQLKSEVKQSTSPSRNGWLNRLFRRRQDEAESSQLAGTRPPAQRVAYPFRVGGRALPVRPLNTTTDNANGGSARSQSEESE